MPSSHSNVSERGTNSVFRGADGAYDAVLSFILDGRVSPNQRLNDKQLCEELGLGRTRVRESLIRLAAEGILEHTPNYGFFVPEIRLEDVIESSRIRTELEALAIRFACEKGLSETTIARLETLCDVIRDEGENGNWRDADWADLEFHRTLLDAAQSRTLNNALQASYATLYSANFYNNQDERKADAAQVSSEHRRIVDALSRRDADAAVAALRAHMDYWCGVLKQRLIDQARDQSRQPRLTAVGSIPSRAR